MGKIADNLKNIKELLANDMSPSEMNGAIKMDSAIAEVEQMEKDYRNLEADWKRKVEQCNKYSEEKGGLPYIDASINLTSDKQSAVEPLSDCDLIVITNVRYLKDVLRCMLFVCLERPPAKCWVRLVAGEDRDNWLKCIDGLKELCGDDWNVRAIALDI